MAFSVPVLANSFLSRIVPPNRRASVPSTPPTGSVRAPRRAPGLRRDPAQQSDAPPRRDAIVARHARPVGKIERGARHAGARQHRAAQRLARRRSTRCPRPARSRRRNNSAWRFWLTLLVITTSSASGGGVSFASTGAAGGRAGGAPPRTAGSSAGIKRAVADADLPGHPDAPHAQHLAEPPRRIARRIVDPDAQPLWLGGRADRPGQPQYDTRWARGRSRWRSSRRVPRSRDCRGCSTPGAMPSRRFAPSPPARYRRASAPKCRCPTASECCSSSSPGSSARRGTACRRRSRRRRSRVFAATASASVVRQSTAQSSALDSRASPLPTSTTSRPSSRTAAPAAGCPGRSYRARPHRRRRW